MGNQIGAQNVRTGPMGMARETTALRKENQELMLAQQSYQMGDMYGAQMHEAKATAFGLAAEKQHNQRFYSGKTVVPWAHPLVNTMPPGTAMFDTSFQNTAVPAMPVNPIGNFNNFGTYGYGAAPFLNTGLAGTTYTPINGGFNTGLTGFNTATAGFSGLGSTAGFTGFNSGLYNGTLAAPFTGTALPLGAASTISAPMGGTYW